MRNQLPTNPNSKGEKLLQRAVPTKRIHVNMYIADVRGISMVAHLAGPMNLPEHLLAEGHLLRWHIAEFHPENRPKGVITDVGADRCSISIPFVEVSDGTTATGKILTFDEIVQLFLRDEPTLREIHRRSS